MVNFKAEAERIKELREITASQAKQLEQMNDELKQDMTVIEYNELAKTFNSLLGKYKENIAELKAAQLKYFGKE